MQLMSTHEHAAINEAVCRGRGGAEETEMTFEVFSMSLFELADYWAPEKTESSYVRSQSRLCFCVLSP